MRDYIEERALEIGEYIIEEGATVRQAARKFGISKSTVHKDVTERLEQINLRLAHEARKVLDVNKSERHIRGGPPAESMPHGRTIPARHRSYCDKSDTATAKPLLKHFT